MIRVVKQITRLTKLWQVLFHAHTALRVVYLHKPVHKICRYWTQLEGNGYNHTKIETYYKLIYCFCKWTIVKLYKLCINQKRKLLIAENLNI